MSQFQYFEAANRPAPYRIKRIDFCSELAQVKGLSIYNAGNAINELPELPDI
jgi:hypothetical protein